MTPSERAAMMRQAADLLTKCADASMSSSLGKGDFTSWMEGRASALAMAASTLTSSAAFCAEQYAKEVADAELLEAANRA